MLARVLLVDDSDAVLAYEQAALGGSHAVISARNGLEALEKMRSFQPDIVLLDLSMPDMDGDEVVALAKADPALAKIPIVIVSSEAARAEACLARGASAFLAKPVRADELRALVTLVLDEARREGKKGGLALLHVRVGPIDLGIPLPYVRCVALMPATTALRGAPFYLQRAIDLHAEPVAVLDLALRLGITSRSAIQDRKLVVVRFEGLSIAISVDDVLDPEELAAGDLSPPDPAALVECRGLTAAITAIARTPRAALPVVGPAQLLPARVLARIGALLAGRPADPDRVSA